MEFGFAAVVKPPEVELRFCGPFDGPQLCSNLSFHRAGDSVCALAGRLHYRDDALAQLAVRAPPAAPAQARGSDAALALAVYEELGTGGLARLEGDFALAIFDAERRRLVARRDPLGGYPLFWARTGDTVALASGLDPLLDLLPSRTISLDHLADFLMLGTGWERPAEGCAYEDIQRVTPAAIVTIDASTGEARHEPCRDWASRAVDPGSDRLDEIAARYRELLRAAARERIASATAAHVSGGMDSSSVALIALDLIRSGGAAATLAALALIYERLPSLARERSYVESVLATDGMAAHRIVADELLHYDNLADPPLHEEPAPGLWSLRSDRALIERAAEVGAGALLTGHGGDDLNDLLPHHLADLIRRGSLVAAWTEACAWARARGSTPWRILQLCGLAHLAPRLRHGGLARLLPQRRQALDKLDDWSVPAWVNADFAARQALSARATDAAARARRLAGSTPMALALAGIARRVGDPSRWLLAAPRGIALSHPFLDPRLIGFGLGLQEAIVQGRYRPDPGQIKPVLAEAMRGMLPEPIRRRRDKRSFNEVYYLGLSRNLPRIRRMIAAAPIDHLGIFDKAVLIDCVEQAALGVVDAYRLRRLDVTLALIAWLVTEPERQRRPIRWQHVVRMRW